MVMCLIFGHLYGNVGIFGVGKEFKEAVNVLAGAVAGHTVGDPIHSHTEEGADDEFFDEGLVGGVEAAGLGGGEPVIINEAMAELPEVFFENDAREGTVDVVDDGAVFVDEVGDGIEAFLEGVDVGVLGEDLVGLLDH